MVAKKNKNKAAKKGTKATGRKHTPYKAPVAAQEVNEPAMAYHVQGSQSIVTKIRAIGNSRGVILNSQLIEAAGINSEAEIIIKAAKGVIVIQAKAPVINTNLSTWDKQFKAAIKKGAKPEKDLFNGAGNEFDLKEW
jgi:antitoxin component of MazEF toxin-antitoxin module